MIPGIINEQYKFEEALHGIIIDLKSLKVLEEKIQEHSMNYSFSIDYKSGDSVYDLSISNIVNDYANEKRHIKSIHLFAYNNNAKLEINAGQDCFEKVEIVCSEKSVFLQLKQEIKDWLEIIKNRNPFICFAPFSKRSEIIRIITSAVLSFLTLAPLVIKEILNGGTVKFSGAIIVFVFFTGSYFLVNLLLSAFFLKDVEIDIGINHTKIRRKFGNWFLTVVLIPVILSWIFSFI